MSEQLAPRGRAGFLPLVGLCCWAALVAVDLVGLLLAGTPRPLLGPVALLAGLDLLPAMLLPLLLLPVRVLLADLGKGGLATGSGELARAACGSLPGSPEHRRRCAGWLAGSLALVGLGWSWLRLAYWLLLNVHDHRLGAAAWVAAAFVLAALAWLAARLLAALLAPRLPGWLLRPALLFPAALLPPLAGAVLLGSSWVGWSRVPWGLAGSVLGPLLALCVAGLAIPRLASPRRLLAAAGRKVRWTLVATAAAGVLPAGWLAGARPEAARLVGERCPWAGQTLAWLRVATDLDRDGHSSLLGGGDCAPFDPARYPGAPEIPGNGVDESCNGRDGLARAVAAPTYLEQHPLVRPGGWSFVLIVMDAVRADHVSALGYPRPTTPRLVELAGRSLVFPWAYSPSSTTRYSIPALLTGRSPSALAWRRKGRNLYLAPGKNRMLQERLQRAGLFTAAVTSSYDIFSASFGLNAGFDRYDTRSVRFASERTIQGRTGTQVTDAALRLLAEAGERPFFLYVHYMDPHAPYEDPDGPTFGDTELDRYDAEILFTDREVGRLLDRLRERPDAARIVVAVTGDHGDQFGERGRTGHGRFVYEEEVHVPLLLHLPGVAARRIEAPVSLLDLAPTVANLMGVPDGWELFQGRNLLHLLAGGETPGSVVVETWPFAAFTERRAALIDLPYKVIFNVRDRSWEVYDLLADPAERANLHPGLPPATRSALERPLADWLEAHPLR